MQIAILSQKGSYRNSAPQLLSEIIFGYYAEFRCLLTLNEVLLQHFQRGTPLHTVLNTPLNTDIEHFPHTTN